MNSFSSFGVSQVAVIVLVAVLLCSAWIIFMISTAKMASRLGRSAVGWLLLSLFIYPLNSIICLYALGETDSMRKKRIIQEEEWCSSVQIKSYLEK